jgi:hypothetical protein
MRSKKRERVCVYTEKLKIIHGGRGSSMRKIKTKQMKTQSECVQKRALAVVTQLMSETERVRGNKFTAHACKFGKKIYDKSCFDDHHVAEDQNVQKLITWKCLCTLFLASLHMLHKVWTQACAL